jgi:hypothetical protein
MVYEVMEMGGYDVWASFGDAFVHDFFFVVGFGFAGFDFHCSGWTVTYAGSKAVAEKVADEAGFAVDDLQGPFGAAWYAVAATGTFWFIYSDNLSFHCWLLPFYVIYSAGSGVLMEGAA